MSCMVNGTKVFIWNWIQEKRRHSKIYVAFLSQNVWSIQHYLGWAPSAADGGRLLVQRAGLQTDIARPCRAFCLIKRRRFWPVICEKYITYYTFLSAFWSRGSFNAPCSSSPHLAPPCPRRRERVCVCVMKKSEQSRGNLESDRNGCCGGFRENWGKKLEDHRGEKKREFWKTIRMNSNVMRVTRGGSGAKNKKRGDVVSFLKNIFPTKPFSTIFCVSFCRFGREKLSCCLCALLL